MMIFRALNFTSWIDENKYCKHCGAEIHSEIDKTYMQCGKCGNILYTLLTPTVIVAVLKGDEILLVCSKNFPPKFFSLISGHVDPGESIEATAKREVREESGIEIKNLQYIGSYSWPFPNKLMFAFIAEYESGNIKIDDVEEIAEANWFPLDKLPNTPNSKYSLARRIISYVKQCKKDNDFSKAFVIEESTNEIIGAFIDDELMSMIRNYTFKQSVRGVIKNMGGVSHVATFPEYRLQGYVKRLINEAFIDMKHKHQCVSVLHPFKESFYEAYGYVGTNDNMLVKASLDCFMPYINVPAEIKGTWEEKRVRAIDVQKEFEQFKYELDLVKNHGLVFLDEMSSEYWIDDHEDVIIVFIKKDNEIMAAAKYI